MPRPLRVMPAYDPAQIDRIMSILVRAAEGRPIDRGDVEASLLEVVQAVGLASDGSEASVIWHEFSVTEPNAREERDAFLRLARADDPLDLARRNDWLALLLRTSATLGQFAGRGRGVAFSPSSLIERNWSSLPPDDQMEFRRSLEQAAAYCGHFVRRGRGRKAKLDTALIEIADLYLDWTGQTIARHRLPYAVESQFIQFAVAVLEPVGQYFEVSASALSGRWGRIVLRERKQESALNEPLAEAEGDED